MRGWTAIVAGIVWAISMSPMARAQTPPAAADPAMESARQIFEGLPETERRAIQDALIWTGDYKGLVDGGFGRGTRAAMGAYARRTGATADGALAAQARSSLMAAANAARIAAGFAGGGGRIDRRRERGRSRARRDAGRDLLTGSS